MAERWTGAAPRLTHVTVEDATDHPAWIVTGTLSDGAISGPYSCKISWASDGGAIYLDEIKLPNGYLGGITHETAS